MAIVAFSAETGSPDAQGARDAGCDGFIAEPIEVMTLGVRGGIYENGDRVGFYGAQGSTGFSRFSFSRATSSSGFSDIATSTQRRTEHRTRRTEDWNNV